MKAGPLTVLPKDVLAAPGIAMERQRVRDRMRGEVYFRVPMAAGEGIVSGGPTTVDATTFAYTFEDIPAGVVTNIRSGQRLRDLWPRTFISLELWYTSPVAGGGNFTAGLRLRQTGPGQSLATPALVLNPDFAIPAPSVANEILFTTYRAGIAVLPALNLCSLTLRRAVDANPNALRLVHAEFVFTEVA